MKFFENGFNGCIECQISSTITKGISKTSNKTTVLDLEILEANNIIRKMNIELNKQFPTF